MMRYQRLSPDSIALVSGRKFAGAGADARIPGYPPIDAKPIRVRSGSGSAPANAHHLSDPQTPENPKQEVSGRRSGDALLQWGHNKRSRGSRAAGDEASAHSRQHVKIQRRAAIAGAERIAAAAAAQAMPPPCGGGYARGANLRACTPLRDPTAAHRGRNAEERSSGHHSRSEWRSPPSPAATSNGFGPEASSPMNNNNSSKPSSDQDTGGGAAADAGGGQEKVSMEQFEWPRIYISLSRKEKEDDFMAMKGAKLPQRPKKRAKNIDKALQYCFPGMWLSDLTRGRYEVREKKCVKKKRRGLKGMENMDSDSE